MISYLGNIKEKCYMTFLSICPIEVYEALDYFDEYPNVSIIILRNICQKSGFYTDKVQVFSIQLQSFAFNLQK